MFNVSDETTMQFTAYESTSDAVIKVVGVGGGGGNAVDHMSKSADSIKGVEFYDVNTDAQVLRKRTTKVTVQIGAQTTGGLGAGANPEVGRQSAEEDREAIARMLDGANMVFVAVGMGGGTGTGAAPVIASIAKEKGALTVAVVTKPFRFEGPRRMRLAEQGIRELSQYVDSLIIIPNDKLQSLGKNITMIEAFNAANDVLRNCVLGITNMITSSGGSTGFDINVDFADVKTVMSDKGHAMIGTGYAEGDSGSDRAQKAMNDAISSPLLENVDISGAKGMLININAGTDFSIGEVYEMMDLVYGFAEEDATIVYGCNYYPEMDGKVSVTLVATGIGDQNLMHQQPKVQPQQVPPFANPTRTDFGNSHIDFQRPTVNTPPTHPNVYGQSGYVEQSQQSVRPQTVDMGRMWTPPDFSRNK